MDTFKIDNYTSLYKRSFPWFRELEPVEMKELRNKLCKNIGISEVLTYDILVNELAQLSRSFNGVNAESDDFKLCNLIKSIDSRAPNKIYINWYRFDRIDEMYLSDLDAYFSDFWYPSSDDIDIFCINCTWVISIHHTGAVSLWRK